MTTNSKNNLQSIIKENFRKTSVRGLPRIINSESLLIKVMWIVTISVLFVFLSIQITNLIIQYRQAETLINTLPWKKNRHFPSVTICNLNPFSLIYDLRHHNLSSIMTPFLYKTKIATMAEMTRLEGLITERETEIYKEYLLTMSSYYDNIDDHFRKHLEYYPLVLEKACRVFYREDRSLKNRLCDKIEPIYIMGYYNCYKVRIYERENEKIETVTINALINKDHDNAFCAKCIVENLDSLRTGALVFLHPNDEHPVSIGEGLFLLPGTQNIIHIKQKKYEMVKDCSNEYPKNLIFHLNKKLYNSTYTQDMCKKISTHAAIRRICNCSTENLPHQVTHTQEHVTYKTDSCYYQNLSHPTLQTRFLDCIADLEGLHHKYKNLYKYHTSDCVRPCNSEDYSVAHSSAKGITKSSALEIYKHYIRDHFNNSYHFTTLEPYEEALQLQAKGNLTEARQILDTTDYLETSFLTIVLMYSDSHAKIMKETFLIGFSTFVSQVGGALTLFSGISLICIAEILELIYDIFKYLCRRVKKHPSNNKLNMNTAETSNMIDKINTDETNNMLNSNCPRQSMELGDL